jgi:hypothetical protein
MTNIRGYSLAMMAMLAVCGEVAAADVTCPAPSAIKEGATSNAGTQQEEANYSAKQYGKSWTGSVSAYDKEQVNLKALSAGEASTLKKGLEACDYSNDGKPTLRLTLDTSAK